MSKNSVYCLANSRMEADEIVDRLVQAGLSQDEISVLFSDGGNNSADNPPQHEADAEVAGTNAEMGGLVGDTLGLIGMGIPESEARHYEGKLTSGNLLISVHSDNPGDLARARSLFKQAGAQDICTAGETYAKGAPDGVMAGPMPV